jgi:hypothetical protein
LKLEKPNRTELEQKKPSQTRKKPSQTKKTEPNRFELVSVFVKNKFRFGYFFDKNRTEPKMITPTILSKAILSFQSDPTKLLIFFIFF